MRIVDEPEYKYWTFVGENFVKIPVCVDFATETTLNSSIRLQRKLWSGIQVI